MTSPRLHLRFICSAAVLTLLFAVVALARAPEVVLAKRPNIIVIQTDDQPRLTFKRKFRGPNGPPRLIMPKTVRGLVRSGAEFRNYYTASPVCSPSRASLLTGQYPQNHRLLTNDAPLGGWSGWQALPAWNHNVPVALQNAGYRTAHFGKILNTYYDTQRNRVDTTVPPGWDRWLTTAFIRSTPYYGFEVNDDGQVRGPFGSKKYEMGVRGVDPASCRADTKYAPDGRRCLYLTDYMTRHALEEIRRNAGPGKRPFYLQLDYQAPHGDSRPPAGPTPASRHVGSASRTKLPRTPAFNERDVSDKPAVVRGTLNPRLRRGVIKRLTRYYQRETETLRAVDDGVGAILRTLRRTGQLDNTYVFYTTDHGVFMGEHRLYDTKFLGYAPASRVGMAVRGPGISPGTKVNEVVGNIDIPATVLSLAESNADYEVDGRSLRRFWRRPGLYTRRPYEISLFKRNKDVNLAEATELTGVPDPGRLPNAKQQTGLAAASARDASKAVLFYRGYRVGPYRFTVYVKGGAELYDLRSDPYEMRNLIDRPAYQRVRQYMRKHLPEVINCSGQACRDELPPWPEPGQ